MPARGQLAVVALVRRRVNGIPRGAVADTPRAVFRAASESSGSALDWERQSVRRLQFVATAAAGVLLAGMPLLLLRQPNLGVRAGFDRPIWLAPVALAVVALLAVLSRWERIRPCNRLDIGLAALVILSGLAGLFRHGLPYAPEDVVRGISPIAAFILFFAVVIPVPPGRMLLAATVAAALDPLMLVVTVWRGNPSPPWNLWLWLFAPNVFVVGLAWLVARTLHRLGQAVERARQMGAYELIERLGHGGMGEVWSAEHRTLARPAAVKLVRPEVLGARDSQAASTMLKRFEREAQATAMLTSAHTIEVYDFGIADDGAFYYVMELLEGMDLETLATREETLPPERVCFLIEQVLHSLRDAHEAGVVHRDIKPANVFVCRRGVELDFVKVLDFGLVKHVDAPDDDDRLTAQGNLAGTPAYMAPEAAQGREVDHRADLYAVGCVAYRLLAGRDVFEGENVMQFIYAHLAETPLPLEEVADRELPPALTEIVMRCLAKDPDERWASADELLGALRETGLAREWTTDRAREWWARCEPSADRGARVDTDAPTVPLDTASGETLPADVASAPTLPVD